MTTIKHTYINAVLADAAYVDSLAEGQSGQILGGYLTWDFAAVKSMLPATAMAGDDRIRGYDVAEVVDGLGSNDVAKGIGDSDSFGVEIRGISETRRWWDGERNDIGHTGNYSVFEIRSNG